MNLHVKYIAETTFHTAFGEVQQEVGQQENDEKEIAELSKHEASEKSLANMENTRESQIQALSDVSRTMHRLDGITTLCHADRIGKANTGSSKSKWQRFNNRGSNKIQKPCLQCGLPGHPRNQCMITTRQRKNALKEMYIPSHKSYSRNWFTTSPLFQQHPNSEFRGTDNTFVQYY